MNQGISLGPVCQALVYLCQVFLPFAFHRAAGAADLLSFLFLGASVFAAHYSFVPGSFLFLVRPGAPSSVHVPSSDALCS